MKQRWRSKRVKFYWVTGSRKAAEAFYPSFAYYERQFDYRWKPNFSRIKKIGKLKRIKPPWRTQCNS